MTFAYRLSPEVQLRAGLAAAHPKTEHSGNYLPSPGPLIANWLGKIFRLTLVEKTDAAAGKASGSICFSQTLATDRVRKWFGEILPLAV